MKRLSAIDVIIIVALIALAAFTLAPAIARMQRNPADARCQANLQRVAEAVALYLQDNNLRFPTNRPWTPPGGSTLGPVNGMVNLSPNPAELRFKSGIIWVEGLYSYTDARARRTGREEASFWRCPNASNDTFPTNPTNQFPRVTCVFNVCLAEQPRMVIRDSRNLMMMREIGRQGVSILRPSNSASMLPNGNPSYPPVYPFLTRGDTLKIPLPESEYLLHGNGSFIVFADGHVKHFTIDYYPIQAQITAANCWNPQTMQWYNYYYANPSTPDEVRLNKSIAISP